MPIEPTKPGHPNVTPQTPQAPPTPPASKDSKPSGEPTAARARDRIQLSDAVRELLAKHGVEEIPTGTLSPERMQIVLDRIRQGHYERPEVREELLGRLRAEIESDPSSE